MSFNGWCWNTIRDPLTRAECMVLFAQELVLVGDARREAEMWCLSFQMQTHLSSENPQPAWMSSSATIYRRESHRSPLTCQKGSCCRAGQRQRMADQGCIF